jgi:hypothetical protein
MQTAFAELNAPAVVPAAFPDWAETMDDWGTKLLAACSTVRARPGRCSARLRLSHSKSGLYGACAWAHRALNCRKWRVLGRAGQVAEMIALGWDQPRDAFTSRVPHHASFITIGISTVMRYS